MRQRIETVGNSFFFEQYLKMYEKDLKELEDLINTLNTAQEGILNSLRTQFNQVPIFSNYSINDFITKSINNYLRLHEDFYVTSLEKLFISRLKDLIKIKTELHEATVKLVAHKKLLVNKAQFKFVSEGTNKVMLKHIIETGEAYTINSNLGYFAIEVRRNKSNTKVLNFGETDKLRKEILNRGGTLYDEDTNPKGERYKVYYMDTDFTRLKWFRARSSEYVAAFEDYRFFEARGNYAISKQVYAYLRANPEAKNKYRVHGKSGR